MQIIRENNTIIKKRKINIQKLNNYDENKMNQAIQYLRHEIQNSYVSHFDNVSYLLKKNNKFFTENNGCISECKRLKKFLKELGLETYFVSCKANGFSNPAGDAFVSEAHVFLIYPSLRNEKVYFTIFDPGFRLETPISFYDLCNSEPITYLLDGVVEVKVNNSSNYPYELIVNRRINYQHQICTANIHWEFNPYYQTLNIDDFNEQLYHAIFSLNLMNYPNDLNKYICIRAKILENIIEVYTIQKNEVFFIDDLSLLSLYELENIFKPYFKTANLTNKQLKVFIENLFMLIHNLQKYVDTIITPDVIKDYKLGKTLNR